MIQIYIQLKISALPSQNASKYDFLNGEDVLPGKKLLEKATAIKRFEYSPLNSELKTNWHQKISVEVF